MLEPPPLGHGPRVFEAQSTEAVCRVGVGVDPLYPNPAPQVEPQQVCRLNCCLHFWEVAPASDWILVYLYRLSGLDCLG